MSTERERLADEYEEEFHRFYPDGLTVADYCNREIPSTCFLAGYDAATKAKEEEIASLRSALSERSDEIAALKAEVEKSKYAYDSTIVRLNEQDTSVAVLSEENEQLKQQLREARAKAFEEAAELVKSIRGAQAARKGEK